MRRLDEKISILRASTAANQLNELVETWSEVFELWAERKPVSDGERFRAQEVQAEISERFVVRYNEDAATIDQKDRVGTQDGRTFDIFSVKTLGRNEWVEITGIARAER